jgi:poly(ADP-ribose) glycohydrolase ARH3
MTGFSPCYAPEKVEGILFGTFLGDAIGAGFEGWPVETIPPLDFQYVLGHPPKTYTDDTQMTISVLEEMVENGRIDQRSLLNRFVKRFEKFRGYGGGLLEVIEQWEMGRDIETAARSLYGGQGSFGDGAAMRVAPISAFFRLEQTDELIRQVRLCSLITHTHPCGVSGAVLQAVAVLLALNDVPAESWLTRLLSLPIDAAFAFKLQKVKLCLESRCSLQQSVDEIGNGAQALEAVPASLFAFLRNPGSFAEAVLWAVSMGGDTDTIGAMAGAIAGARFGMGGIPFEWLSALENGEEGKDFLIALARRAF